MEELRMNNKETKDFFVHAFRDKSIVPILGSGFSRGFKTTKGGVCSERHRFKKLYDRYDNY